VVQIGNSSFVLDQAIYSGNRCAARATSVIVLMDDATRKSTPLPQEARAKLEKLQVKNG